MSRTVTAWSAKFASACGSNNAMGWPYAAGETGGACKRQRPLRCRAPVQSVAHHRDAWRSSVLVADENARNRRRPALAILAVGDCSRGD
eukprot:5497841-Prymnesium_polylepis.1